MGPKKECDSLNKTIIEAVEKCLIENNGLIKRIADIVVQEIKVQIGTSLKKFEDKLDSVCEENKKLQQRINFLGQCDKKRNVRISGLEESENENILKKVVKLFEDKLHVNINMGSISCYRNKTTNAGMKGRPITVKFDLLEHKLLVMKNRNKLRNSSIFINDDLTINNVILLSEAKKKFGRKNAWYINGSIFVSGRNGREKIKDLDDVERISMG